MIRIDGRIHPTNLNTAENRPSTEPLNGLQGLFFILSANHLNH